MKLKRYITFAIILFLGFFLSCVNASTKAPVDITKMSILDIQAAFDKGYLSSELLVKLYLERIEEYDSLFNSINQLNPNALDEAKKLDQERLTGKVRGKLHGIPILVKNNIDVKGFPTTAGAKALEDNYPNENATVIQRLIDEGAIILGTTNMSEFAFSASNSYSSYGYVRNVFNSNYSPYGSSGGSAVSLGAVFAAASLGTDTNSSVRVPAAGAGVVGFRPTMGKISMNGVLLYDITRDTVGILSRTVADNALLTSIIAGKDSKDDKTKLAVSYDFNTYNKEYNVKKVRVAVIGNFFKGIENAIVPANGLTDSGIYDLSRKSLEKFKSTGVELVYVDEFLTNKYYTIAGNTMSGIMMCESFNEYIQGTTGHIRNFNDLVKDGRYIQPLENYIDGCSGRFDSRLEEKNERKKEYRNYVDKFMKDNNVDAIVYPVVKNKPYAYNEKSLITPSSSIGSVIGYPSISVPIGMYDGFSYSVEFLVKANEEELLFNIAGAFERSNGNSLEAPLSVPSLYEIPQSVENLKVIYETGSFNEKGKKQLYKEIRVFFENYENNDNVSEDAQKLIDRYNEKSKSKKSIWSIVLLVLKIVGSLFLLFVVYFIYRLIRRKVRRYLRRRRKNRGRR